MLQQLRFSVSSFDSTALAVIKWTLGGKARPILASHAAGLCKETWEPVVEELCALDPHARPSTVYAFDCRGHGESKVSSPTLSDWQLMGQDTVSVLEEIREKDIVVVGHSMSGASALMANLISPSLVPAVIAVEPIVFRPPPPDPTRENQLANLTLKRRETFPDRDTAFASYSRRPPLSLWDARALRAYVAGGFEESMEIDDSGLSRPCVRLCCRPPFEASIYRTTNDVISRLGDLQCPVAVVTGEHSTHLSKISGRSTVEYLRDIARQCVVERPAGFDEFVVMPNAGHFLVLEKPKEFAALLGRNLRALSV